MFTISIDTKAVQQVPPSLKEWTEGAGKGPKTLVAEFSCSSAQKPASPAACYTLKGWTSNLGPHALVARLAG